MTDSRAPVVVPQVHPDKSSSPHAHLAFHRLRTARTVLSSHTLRMVYSLQLALAGAQAIR